MALGRRKTLLGCLFGCGGLVALVVVAFVAFMIWLTRPGELLDVDRLVGNDTTGYVAWTLSYEDEPTREFFLSLVEAMQTRPEDLPPELRDTVGPFFALSTQKAAEKDIEQMLPMTGAWTMAPGAEEPIHLTTVSIEKMGKQLVLMDMALGRLTKSSDKWRKEKYRGERIYQIGNPPRVRMIGSDESWELSSVTPTFFLRGNDIFFATDIEMAKRAIDRLADDAEPSATASELQRRLAAMPTDNMRGVISNNQGTVHAILSVWTEGLDDLARSVRRREQAAEEPGLTPPAEKPEIPAGEPIEDEDWATIQWLELTGRFIDNGNFEITMHLVCPDVGCEAAELPARVDGWSRAAQEAGADITVRLEPTADGATVTMVSEDLIRWVETSRNRLMELAREEEAGPEFSTD